MKTDGSRFMPRAQRYSLPTSILYRPAGDARWREGWTENISQSGVLFHGREPIDLEASVEVMLDVPAQVLGNAAGASSLGRGRIVRRGTERSDTRPAYAATITDWELLQLDPRRI